MLLGCIPARYAAQRFPGKILHPLLGKPMLQWVLEGARESLLVSEWLVATDDERIAEVAWAAGVEAVLTDPSLPSGTDRLWAATRGRTEATHILNIQGDEPLIDGATVDALARTLLEAGCPTATLARPFFGDEDPSDPNRVKVMRNDLGQACYFSRALIPYPRDPGIVTPLLHLGCYGYTRAALQRWVALPPHPIELAEKLEQLRALMAGLPMAVGMVETRLMGVDTPEDVLAIEAALQASGRG